MNNRIAQLTTLHDKGKLHHAIMFSGPRGVGKMQAASALARHILQADGVTHPDLLVIQNEKAISIDQIRDIKDYLTLKSSHDQGRVVIIDAIDQLRPHLSGSLLKVLEEPQRGNFLILIYHNETPLLDTIKSRVITINFPRLDYNSFVAAIPTKDDAETLYRISGGSISSAEALIKANWLMILQKMRDSTIDVDIFIKNWDVMQLIVPFFLTELAKDNAKTFERIDEIAKDFARKSYEAEIFYLDKKQIVTKFIRQIQSM